MLMVQLDVGPTDALARLRAHAFSHALTASETARLILARRLILAADGPGPVADLGGPR
jgi:hypothetical protein